MSTKSVCTQNDSQFNNKHIPIDLLHTVSQQFFKWNICQTAHTCKIINDRLCYCRESAMSASISGSDPDPGQCRTVLGYWSGLRAFPWLRPYLHYEVDLDLDLHLSLHTKLKKVARTRTERRVPELIPVLGSQPAGDVSHKPGGRLPLLSARPAVTLATIKRAATNFAAWWTEARRAWIVCLGLLPRTEYVTALQL